jgi:hypothetical protein
MTATIGTAARLTVKETRNGPKFVRHQAGQESAPDRPPVRQNGEALPWVPGAVLARVGALSSVAMSS